MIPKTYKGKALVHSWPYINRDGKTLGFVARYEDSGGKDVIPFFKPNGSGFKAGAPAEPRPLFGLDSVTDTERAVLVAEGEKCAAALHSLGLQAVTSQGGCKAAGKSDWAALSGCLRVYILPDNDPPGRGYAQDVAACLAALDSPPELYSVSLPGLPDKGDVVDWIQAREAGQAELPGTPVDGGIRKALELVIKVEAVPVQIEAAETLVPLDEFKLPSMRADLLPGCLGRFAEAVAAHTETPIELPVSMVIGALATAVQGRYRIMVKPGYFEPLNIWTQCALNPGNRKSAVVESATAPLLAWEWAESKRMAPEIREAEQRRKVSETEAESLRKQAAKAKAIDKGPILESLYQVVENMPEIPRAPQLITTDSTPERLGVLLADNGERLSWLSSEGGLFDMLAGRYSGGIPNLDIMLKAHAGDHERVDRGSRPPVYLRHPALTVGLSPQHSVLRGLVQKPGFRGRGLLARFLYFMPDSPIGSRTLDGPPIPEKVEAEYSALLTRILDRDEADQPRLLNLLPDAYAEWLEFALDIEHRMAPGGEFETITDWASKLSGAAARLAGLFHAAEHDKPEEVPVSLETMGAALELAAVLTRHTMAAFGMMGSDATVESAKHVWGWVERNRVDRFTGRDCWQALKGRFTRMEELRESLLVLMERGYLKESQPPRKGPGRKPSPVYQVTKEASRGWA